MIFDRSGDPVTVRRVATLADVSKLEGRKTDKQDREALANGSYVIVVGADGRERLYHLAYLHATDGSREITAAIDALKGGAL